MMRVLLKVPRGHNLVCGSHLVWYGDPDAEENGAWWVVARRTGNPHLPDVPRCHPQQGRATPSRVQVPEAACDEPPRPRQGAIALPFWCVWVSVHTDPLLNREFGHGRDIWPPLCSRRCDLRPPPCPVLLTPPRAQPSPAHLSAPLLAPTRPTVKRVNIVHLRRLAMNASVTPCSDLHKALLHDLLRLSVFSAYSALRKYGRSCSF